MEVSKSVKIRDGIIAESDERIPEFPLARDHGGEAAKELSE